MEEERERLQLEVNNTKVEYVSKYRERGNKYNKELSIKL